VLLVCIFGLLISFDLEVAEDDGVDDGGVGERGVTVEEVAIDLLFVQRDNVGCLIGAFMGLVICVN